HTITNKLFEFAGFTYTSNFLSSEYYKKLILPFANDRLQMSAEQIQARKVIAGCDAATTYTPLTPGKNRGDDWYKSETNAYKLGYPSAGLTRESGLVTDAGGGLTFTDDSGLWSNDVFTCQLTGRYNIEVAGKLILKMISDDGDDIEFDEGQFEYFYQLLLVKSTGGSTILETSWDV